MNWPQRFLEDLAPGLLGGATFGDWARLLRRHGTAVHPRYVPRALVITLLSLRNSLMRRVEQRRFAAEVNQVVLQPPLFVLGHWRTGTTHLHQLIAQDPRFAFPSNSEVFFPHTFLTTGAADERWLARVLPRQRPIDQMEWNAASPQEDEFAACITTFQSPYVGAFFPRRTDEFAKYLTFQNVPPADLAAWRRNFEFFLKKLQWRHRRPLVLKSPPHTARIRLLLEMFPGARFVHLHREPFTVFQSTRRMLARFCATQNLQPADPALLDEWTLRQFSEMYDSFFAEQPLIPPGQFHEIAFEQLERDPLGELRKMYAALNLPAFEIAEPALRRYTASLAGYQKSAYPELPPPLRARVATAWHRAFQAWGYDPEPVPATA